MAGNLTEVVTALTSTTVAAGGAFSFSARTSNLGNTSTGGGSTSRIFLSADPLIDPFDTVLQIRTVPALGAFSEFAQNYVVTLPLNLAPGTYYIGGLADYENQIAETNESDNNYNRLTITVTPPPNLTEVITALTSTTVAAGGSFSFAANTVNTGPTIAAGSTARVFLSTDPIITAQDTLLASHVTPSLNPNQGNAQNFAVNLPANLAPGTYYIGGLADYFNQIGEGNENDNNGNVVTINVTAAPAPDLRAVLTAISSTTLSPGDYFHFFLNTVNEGNAATAPSSTFLYLSTDPTITRQDTLLGYGSVGALNPGAGFGGSLHQFAQLPSDLAPGTYYIGALADNENQVGESNEANNNGNVITLTVRTPAPDLRAIVTAMSSNTVAPGGEFRCSLNTVNEGNAASTASTTYYYLSTDPFITREDMLLGGVGVPALNPGAGFTSQFGLLPTSELAPGTYYVGAIADNENQVAELNESNNNGNVVTMIVSGANLTSAGPLATNASSLQLSQVAASSFVEGSASLAGPMLLATRTGATPDLIAPESLKHV